MYMSQVDSVMLVRVTAVYIILIIYICVLLCFSITTTLRPSNICTGTVRSRHTYPRQQMQMLDKVKTQQQAAKNLKRARRKRKSPKARLLSRY